MYNPKQHGYEGHDVTYDSNVAFASLPQEKNI